MKNKSIYKLIAYELRNAFGNWYSLFFGLLLPLFLVSVIPISVAMGSPEEIRLEMITSMAIGISITPLLSIMFVGNGLSYSAELEQYIIRRMELFDFKQQKIIVAKLIAHFLLLTFTLLLYWAYVYIRLGVKLPTSRGLGIYIISFIVLGLINFILSHGIAAFFSKNGPAYAVVMGIYFIMMVFSGEMGVATKELPIALQKVSNFLPTSYIVNDFYKVWTGGAYDYSQFIKSIVFFSIVSIACLVVGRYYQNRK